MTQFKPALQYDIQDLPTEKTRTPLAMPGLPPTMQRNDKQPTIPTRVIPAITKPTQAPPARLQRKYGTLSQGVTLIALFLIALLLCMIRLHSNKYDASTWLALCTTCTVFIALCTAWIVARRWKPAKPTLRDRLEAQGKLRQTWQEED